MPNKYYTVYVKNAPKDSTYSMYISGNPNCIAGGKATESNYSFNVSVEYTGDAKIRVHIPKRTRTFANIAFPIMFKADGKDITIDVSDYYPPPSSTISKDTKSKKLLTNKLQEAVQKKKKEVSKEDNKEEITTSSSPKPLRGPDGRFISSKKPVKNKLQEAVQNKKASLDSDKKDEE
jgi:hypothetical protein